MYVKLRLSRVEDRSSLIAYAMRQSTILLYPLRWYLQGPVEVRLCKGLPYLDGTPCLKRKISKKELEEGDVVKRIELRIVELTREYQREHGRLTGSILEARLYLKLPTMESSVRLYLMVAGGDRYASAFGDITLDTHEYRKGNIVLEDIHELLLGYEAYNTITALLKESSGIYHSGPEGEFRATRAVMGQSPAALTNITEATAIYVPDIKALLKQAHETLVHRVQTAEKSPESIDKGEGATETEKEVYEHTNYVSPHKITSILAESYKTQAVIQEVVREHGLDLAAGSIVLSIREPGATLRPLYEKIVNEIFWPLTEILPKYSELEKRIIEFLGA